VASSQIGWAVAVTWSSALNAFNDTVATEEKLPDFGRRALAAVVGNTKSIWPRIRAALEREPQRLSAPHPFDRYVEESLNQACESVPVRVVIFWTHESQLRVLLIQRIAQVVGLAALSPSHFSIHPDYGPWVGLRAVAVFDVDGPSEPPPLLKNPSEHCSQPCMPPFQEAQSVAAQSFVPLAVAIKENWRRWARVRQVCPVAQAEQYSDEQLEYHYTKDTRLPSSLGSKRG
jgi:hypothetical protein